MTVYISDHIKVECQCHSEVVRSQFDNRSVSPTYDEVTAAMICKSFQYLHDTGPITHNRKDLSNNSYKQCRFNICINTPEAA